MAKISRLWKALHKAELDGRLARKLGLKKEHCPHVKRGFSQQLREAWMIGWKDQDREIVGDRYTVEDFIREHQKDTN